MVNQTSNPTQTGAQSVIYTAAGAAYFLVFHEEVTRVYLGVLLFVVLVLCRVWLISAEKAYGSTQTIIESAEAKEFAPAKAPEGDSRPAPEAGKDHAGAPA